MVSVTVANRFTALIIPTSILVQHIVDFSPFVNVPQRQCECPGRLIVKGKETSALLA